MEAFAATVVSKLLPFVFTVVMLAAIMLLTMGVGWASGILLKKMLGIGGN